MISLIIAIHVIVCTLLITIILIQAGRGGGLVEGFSGVESMFGSKTNTFLTRTTTVLASVFFLSCVSLALLSVRQSRSLMRNIKVDEPAKQTIPELPKSEKEQPQNITASEEKPEVPKSE